MKNKQQATALTYSGIGAPTITAKGQDDLAIDIIALAEASGVHIHKDEHLSEFLQTLELGEEIPEELFRVMAEILSFVYMLEGKDPRDIDESV